MRAWGIWLPLALLGGLGWWGVGLHLPVEVVLRPVQVARAPAPDRPPGVRILVRRDVPQVESFAVGDGVRFDRYGVLAPVAGTSCCVVLPAWADVQTVTITPLGGSMTYARLVDVTAVPAGCD